MCLVDDEQVEPVAQPVHVPQAALERCDRDRRDHMNAVAKTAYGAGIEFSDLTEPLVEEDPRGDQAQRAHAGPRHGRERDPRLSASCGQHDDAAAAGQLPGAERRVLVGPQLDTRPLCRMGVSFWDLVREWYPRAFQVGSDRRMFAGRRSMCLDPPIPEDARKRGHLKAGRRIEEQQGPAIEPEQHGGQAKQ